MEEILPKPRMPLVDEPLHAYEMRNNPLALLANPGVDMLIQISFKFSAAATANGGSSSSSRAAHIQATAASATAASAASATAAVNE